LLLFFLQGGADQAVAAGAAQSATEAVGQIRFIGGCSHGIVAFRQQGQQSAQPPAFAGGVLIMVLRGQEVSSSAGWCFLFVQAV